MSSSQSELYRIAGSLSGAHGIFSADDLVHYGSTVIVKPGAVTDEGVALSGVEISRLLGPDFSVFPIGLEYAPSESDAMAFFGGEDIDEELDALDDELDSFDDAEDELGGLFEKNPAKQEARLKKRYMRVYGRFAKCRSLILAGKGHTSVLHAAVWPFALLAKKDKKLARRARKCDRQQRRLMKIRQKMQRKGFDVSSLPRAQDLIKTLTKSSSSPATVTTSSSTQVSRSQPWLQRRRAGGPPPWWIRKQQQKQVAWQSGQLRQMRGPRRGGYVPTSQEVSPWYQADQAALEREASSMMPAYMGAQDELAADLRAEADGYGFSGVEHDYYGVEDISIVFSEEEDLFGDDDFDDDDFDDDDFGDDDFGDDDFDDDDEEFGRAMNRARAAAVKKAARAHARGKHKAATRMMKRVARLDKKLKKRSRMGGVDYGRLQPKTPGMEGPAVIGVAIRRRRRNAPAKVAIRCAAARMGYDPGHDAKLIDVMAADMLGVVTSDAYSPVQGIAAFSAHTDESDWMGGHRNAFPYGADAPLPPPRRAGPEVFAG